MKVFAVVPVSRPSASRSGSPGVPWIEPSRCDVPRLRWPFLPALSSLTACTALAVSKGALSRSGRRPQAQARPRKRMALVEAFRGKTSRTGARRGLHSAGPVLSTGTLPVGDGFDLYYEEHGSPDAIPVVFLHGGPGAGCSRRMAQLFDPEKYRVILFDQRGCGKSSRKDSANAEDQLEGNTTWHLVEDLEVLRAHLKIDRWVVCGGSWGTCLALAYASKHPACVLGMELEYFCGPKGGARSLARGAWDSFAGWLPWAETRSARAIAAAFRRAALGEDAHLD